MARYKEGEGGREGAVLRPTREGKVQGARPEAEDTHPPTHQGAGERDMCRWVGCVCGSCVPVHVLMLAEGVGEARGNLGRVSDLFMYHPALPPSLPPSAHTKGGERERGVRVPV